MHVTEGERGDLMLALTAVPDPRDPRGGLRGLRRGELVGLRWIGLDLADATLTVTQSPVELPGVVAESEPKTAACDRTTTLDLATVQIIADHRQRQRRMYAEQGTTA